MKRKRCRKAPFFVMVNSLAHTKWVCKYHIVFTPKYRRKIIYNQLRVDIRTILKDLCKWKGVEITEGNQSLSNIEIILVDDASPDRCGIICEEYAAKDARFIFEKSELLTKH
ncbi:MAG: transposase [Acidaminococcaceae bacterium]|nr:transposase [Acidaminococcaceae bacterium]